MCKACDARGKTWIGEDQRCGFTSENFDPDNWNCATLNRLRKIAEIVADIETMEDCSIVFIPVTEEGWIVLSWYKSSGKTSSARFMRDYVDIPLTLEIAEKALEQYKEI